MLILVGVTVAVVLNGGLFSTAKNAAKDTQVEADRETLQSAVIGAIDTKTLEIPNENALLNNLPVGWDVIGNGPFTCTSPKGNKFKVTKDGDIKENKTLTDLEKYILGEDGEGGVELFGAEGTTGILDTDFSFINIPEELQNNGGLTFKTFASVSSSDEIVPFKDGEDTVESNGSVADIYFTYDGATYKFRTLIDDNFSSGKTLADVGVKDISYDETTRVGKTVNYNNKEWIILYDDSEHGLQMISKEPLQKDNSNIRLGDNDPTLAGKTITAFEENKSTSYLNLEKGVYSYNNAVKTLNDVCGELVAENSKITSVRSVGSKATGDPYADDVEKYTQKAGDTNTNLIKWPETSSDYNAGVGNGKGKKTDLNYEEDYDRMVALGINVTDETYWLASRVVAPHYDRVDFYVRCVEDGMVLLSDVWVILSDGYGGGMDSLCAVRPVVSLSSDALVAADSSAEYDYTIGE